MVLKDCALPELVNNLCEAVVVVTFIHIIDAIVVIVKAQLLLFP